MCVPRDSAEDASPVDDILRWHTPASCPRGSLVLNGERRVFKSGALIAPRREDLADVAVAAVSEFGPSHFATEAFIAGPGAARLAA